jgi:hypothetical protein
MKQNQPSLAGQSFSHFGRSRDNAARFVGQSQILQCCAAQEVTYGFSQVRINCHGPTEPSREAPLSDSFVYGISLGRNPNTASGKFSLEIRHDPLIGVEHKAKKIVFRAAGAPYRTLPNRSCLISILFPQQFHYFY